MSNEKLYNYERQVIIKNVGKVNPLGDYLIVLPLPVSKRHSIFHPYISNGEILDGDNFSNEPYFSDNISVFESDNDSPEYVNLPDQIEVVNKPSLIFTSVEYYKRNSKDCWESIVIESSIPDIEKGDIVGHDAFSVVLDHKSTNYDQDLMVIQYMNVFYWVDQEDYLGCPKF